MTILNTDNGSPQALERNKWFRQIKPLIPSIIDEALGPSEYGEYDLLPLICISKALNNIGVKSRVLSSSCTLLTLKGAYNFHIDAVSVGKTIYGGEGRIGWDCLMELQREKIHAQEQNADHQKITTEAENLIELVIPNNVATHQDDNLSKKKATHITLEDFVKLNVPNGLVTQEEIQKELGRYQSIIDEFIFKALTTQTVVKSKKRMRL